MRQFELAVKCVCLAAFLFSADAQSSNFSINPLRIYLDGKTRSGTVVLENQSDESLMVQTTMNLWSQQDGRDDLIVPTEDLVVSPPIFTVKAKSKQVIRVGNLKKPDEFKESTYRLYIDEVPPPRKPGETGVVVAVRMSLPVFVAPSGGKAQSDLRWKLAPVDAKSVRLNFRNAGNAHIQVTGVRVALPDGTPLALIPSTMVYILPGHTHVFTMKTDKVWNNEALRVMIKSDTAAPGVETEVKPE